MRDWEVWNKEIAEELLKLWGDPTDTTITNAHDIWMKQTADLISPKSSSILDIPCGLGHLYQHLREDIIYIGIDNSESMIKIAKYYQPDNNFYVSDAYNLKAPKCDTVCCIDLLMHVPEKDQSKILSQLWDKTIKELIFTVLIGNSGYREEKKIESGKTRIRRIDTLPNVRKSHSHLEEVQEAQLFYAKTFDLEHPKVVKYFVKLIRE